jgi:hypothetical protein
MSLQGLKYFCYWSNRNTDGQIEDKTKYRMHTWLIQALIWKLPQMLQLGWFLNPRSHLLLLHVPLLIFFVFFLFLDLGTSSANVDSNKDNKGGWVILAIKLRDGDLITAWDSLTIGSCDFWFVFWLVAWFRARWCFVINSFSVGSIFPLPLLVH